MSVGSWEPDSDGLTEVVAQEVREAAARLEAQEFGLAPEAIARLAPFARQRPGCDWAAIAEPLGDDDVVALIRFFTLAERLPGWEAGAKSPVIPLVRLLKARGSYPDDLTPWIKANTDNRFLPHGSLMDRL